MAGYSIRTIPTSARKLDDFTIGNARIYKREIDQAVANTQAYVRKDLNDTVRTWRRKPVFVVGFRYERGTRIIEASTDNQIYNWLDEGTGVYGPLKRPIIITPRRAKMLRFLPVYFAKTAPNRIIAQPGGPALMFKPVFARRVIQQGIRPRRFWQRLAKRAQKVFDREMAKALTRAAGYRR